MTQLNEQRTKVFLDRYARKNDSGVSVERTPEEMWVRVAKNISDSPKELRDFVGILDEFRFVPGGRILTGAGVGSEQTFYNCYVIPVEPKPSTRAANPNVGNDSREAIFDTIATMVDIMSRGGGVGINWSTLRPSGAYLSRVSGTASGPVGWMDVASKAVGEVEQGGSRRGAAMFMIDDWHPDLLKFIEAKRDLKKITNANVSVAISDKFMKAVKDNAGWSFEFPNPSEPAYNSEWNGDLSEWKARGYGVSIYRSMPARTIWNAITDAAWHNGEPGVVFLDRYNQQSTGRGIEKIISVNPCGEQGLGAYSVCNLGSMNLAAYVIGNSNGVRGFNWEAFRADTAIAVRFLDNVIDKSFYWDQRSRDAQTALRRIGLGVMGLADALIDLRLRYGEPEAVTFTENVFMNMKDVAIETSAKLAEEKGPAGAYDNSVWNRPYLVEYGKRHNGGAWLKPLRNLFFLTQAPTGTTSILAGVNSGIEPYFAAEYTRTDRTGTHRVISPPWARLHVVEVPGPQYVVANDVKVEEHIAMQAAAQKYIDSSVSKTINAPNSHKVEDVDKAYMMAYDSGLKGVAYFRDGCGRDQVLSTEGSVTPSDVTIQILQDDVKRLGDVNRQLDEQIAQLEEIAYVGPKASVFKRSDSLVGQTFKRNTSMGTMYLTVNEDNSGTPVEIFVNVGKAGSDVMSMGEALGRLVSLALQQGIALPEVAKQLVGVGGTSAFNPGLVHAIGKTLDGFTPHGGRDVEPEEEEVYEQADPPQILQATTPTNLVPEGMIGQAGVACPDCHNFSVVREEGCAKCQICGWSAC